MQNNVIYNTNTNGDAKMNKKDTVILIENPETGEVSPQQQAFKDEIESTQNDLYHNIDNYYNEPETVVIASFLVNLDLIQYALDNGFKSHWLELEPNQILYKGIEMAYKNKALLTKSFFMDLVRARKNQNKISERAMDCIFEDYFEQLIKGCSTTDINDFKMIFAEVKNQAAQKETNQMLRDYVEKNKYGEDPAENLKSLCEAAQQITRRYHDNAAGYDLAELDNEAAWGGLFDIDMNDKTYYSGILAIDSDLRGLKKGQMMLVQGATGAGKSAFSRYYARAANKAGANVLYCHYEETNKEYMQKLIISDLYDSTRQVVSSYDISSGTLDNQTTRALIDQADAFYNEQKNQGKCFDLLTLTDKDDVNRIISYIKESGKSYDFVVVDHIGLINKDEFVEDTDPSKYGRVAQRLADFARENKIAMIITQQANREATKKDHYYGINTLEASSQPAQYSYKTVGIWSEDDHIEIWINKNRDGRAGNVVTVGYNSPTYTIKNEVIDLCSKDEQIEVSKGKTKAKADIVDEEIDNVLSKFNMDFSKVGF